MVIEEQVRLGPHARAEEFPALHRRLHAGFRAGHIQQAGEEETPCLTDVGVFRLLGGVQIDPVGEQQPIFGMQLGAELLEKFVVRDGIVNREPPVGSNVSG